MQKEGKSGSSEEPKEEKSPEKKTDKKEKEEKPKKEKKPTINYPEPKRSKMEASFIGTKRLPPTKVLNKKGEEVEKAGALVMANGKPLPKHVAHIAIPPAWQHVRINPDPNGEALVAGTDQRGRRQVKYSEAHDGRVATIKFGKVRKFEANIDRVIKNIERNYKGDKKEQALCLRLIEQTGARADTGNNEGEVKTYGASSLQNKHIKVNDDGSVAVEFIGKHGKPNYYKVNDPALSKILKERAKRPDKEQNVFDTDYRKLKKFSKEVSNNTPKAFRTRVGTNRAKEAVAKMPMPKTEKELMKARLTVAEAVSKYLCNTRKVCLEKYIDPIVFKAWKIKGE
jgi:DNA topoisomerase-1